MDENLTQAMPETAQTEINNVQADPSTNPNATAINNFNQNPYMGNPNMMNPNMGYYQNPVVQLKTNRGLAKFILLSLITFGIYSLVVMSSVSTDINVIASRYDGKKTMHYCLLAFIFTGLTFGIAPIVWYHRISARIGNELARRALPYSFGAGSFWGWYVLGSFIFVGPFIYHYKLFKSMNILSADFNARG